MFWLWQRLLRRAFTSQRETLLLGGGLDHLARSGAGAWLLAQEKARLDFLAAKEAYTTQGGRRAGEQLWERLVQLQATNAVVQALINEQQLERLLQESEREAGPPAAVGKSR